MQALLYNWGMARLVQRRSNCPISHALDIFGDKWSLLVIRDLLFKDKHHFGEFLRAEEKIASNILSDRLQRLEAQGLIRKTQDPHNLTQFRYRLSEKGLDLLPVLLEMIAWSAKYDPNTAASRGFIERIEQDRETLIAEHRARHQP